MVMNPVRCVLLAAAAAALTGPMGALGQDVEEAPVAVPAPVTANASVAVEEARALMQERRHAEALERLYPLAQGAEVNADVVFMIGLASMERSQQPDVPAAEREALLKEAIAAFRFMLINRPELVRVRLELARAFFFLGDDDLAREHFEEVLAGDPPQAVVANVRRFLVQIRARRLWSLRGGIALAPDTNIGATSEERTIYIGGLPFERDAEELSTSGVGVSAWLSGEYQYPLSDRSRLRAGADVSRREYAGSQFDQTFASVHLGPRWLVGANAEASLLANVQRRWRAGAPYYDAPGARLEAARRISRRVTANARASLHDRRYRTDTFLDGPVADVTLGGNWIVSSTVRADAALGWGQERTEAERWRHQRKWLRMGLTVALPLGFTVGGSGEMRWTDYEGNWSFYTQSATPREDRTRALRLSVYNRAFAWMGFSPRLTLVHEVRDTNAQLYDYRRTGGELSFVRVF